MEYDCSQQKKDGWTILFSPLLLFPTNRDPDQTWGFQNEIFPNDNFCIFGVLFVSKVTLRVKIKCINIIMIKGVHNVVGSASITHTEKKLCMWWDWFSAVDLYTFGAQLGVPGSQIWCSETVLWFNELISCFLLTANTPNLTKISVFQTKVCLRVQMK